jgi:hypothetical protein
MIIPYLKENGMFSLYNTVFDYKEGDKNFRSFGDKTDYSRFGYDEYDFIGPFKEGYAIAKIGKSSFYIDSEEKRLKLNHKYFEIREFKNGLAAVSREFNSISGNNQWRFINKNGIEVIDDCFDQYIQHSNGYINVTKYSGYAPSRNGFGTDPDEYSHGIIQNNGNIVCEIKENASAFFHKKFIHISIKGDQYTYFNSYVDYNGTELNNKVFSEFEYIGNTIENLGIAKLKKNHEYVVIDDDLNIIKNLGNIEGIGEQYVIFPNLYGCYFYGKVCPIKLNRKWGLINEKGEFVISPKYDFIGGFTDIKEWKLNSYGCAPVGIEINSVLKYSAINSQFQEISEFLYDEICLFEEGIATVRIGEKWGAMNSLGEIIVPIEFNHISDCHNGFIEVGLGDYERFFIGHFGFFDKLGKKITKIVYESLRGFENGFSIFKKNGFYGLLNNFGNEVIYAKYEELEYVYEDIYLAKKDGLKYYIDTTGREFKHKS